MEKAQHGLDFFDSLKHLLKSKCFLFWGCFPGPVMLEWGLEDTREEIAWLP